MRISTPSIIIPVLVLVLVAFGAAGCSQHYRVDPILSTDKETQTPWEVTSKAEGIGSTVTIMNPYTYRPVRYARKSVEGDVGTLNTWDKRSLYEVAQDWNERDAVRQEARNELQRAIMRLSDEASGVHLAGIRATETNVNLILGATAIGLTGAASVAAAETAKALAAAATGAQGRAGPGQRAGLPQRPERIDHPPHRGRPRITRVEIEKKWNKSMAEYPVESAISEAMEYHEKSSFYHGLALVRAAAEEKAKSVDDDTKNLKNENP